MSGFCLELAPAERDEEWLGIVHFGDRRRATVVICLDEDEVMDGDFDPAPLEWLIAQTTPSGSGPILL